MSHAVVEIHNDSIRGLSVRVLGLHADPISAERERRRRHLGRAIDDPGSLGRHVGYRYVVAPVVTT